MKKKKELECLMYSVGHYFNILVRTELKTPWWELLENFHFHCNTSLSVKEAIPYPPPPAAQFQFQCFALSGIHQSVIHVKISQVHLHSLYPKTATFFLLGKFSAYLKRRIGSLRDQNRTDTEEKVSQVGCEWVREWNWVFPCQPSMQTAQLSPLTTAQILKCFSKFHLKLKNI